MNEKMQKLRNRKEDQRFLDVMGFLVAKGFLKTTNELVVAKPMVKLEINDVLWAGEKVEPRILEVLPAAMIHFPRTFINTRKTPDWLKNAIGQIKRGEECGDDFNGIRYTDMLKWANLRLPDLRTNPTKENKVLRSFRFSPRTINSLETLSSAKGLSQTELLESLIEKMI